eukprot:TRINITY_DN5859_c0_g1_i1.p1 TRINITY_DN5859_c0_g1~~TRINITY_DN5859_c0_g1_i1.p1  ORF type:complete len:270 (+),score=49.62 TRINITY_DN5859_c0_g1_i1:64-873(+)
MVASFRLLCCATFAALGLANQRSAAGECGGGVCRDGDARRTTSMLVRWKYWEVNNATATNLCWLMEDVRKDGDFRKKKGWQRTATPAIPYAYAVKRSKGRGLGLFTREMIKKGAVLHKNLPEYYVRLPLEPAGDVAAFVAGRYKTIENLIKWCIMDNSELRDGVLCELDDGRYVNDVNENEVGNAGNCLENEHWTCATRDIMPGEEILENYTEDGVVNEDDYEAEQATYQALLELAGEDLQRNELCYDDGNVVSATVRSEITKRQEGLF